MVVFRESWPTFIEVKRNTLLYNKMRCSLFSLEKRGGPAIGQGWRTNVPSKETCYCKSICVTI